MYGMVSLQVTLEHLHPVSAGGNCLCSHDVVHSQKALEGESPRICVEPPRIDYPPIAARQPWRNPRVLGDDAPIL